MCIDHFVIVTGYCAGRLCRPSSLAARCCARDADPRRIGVLFDMCIDQKCSARMLRLTGHSQEVPRSRCSARDKHPRRMFENVPRYFGAFVGAAGVTRKISRQGRRDIGSMFVERFAQREGDVTYVTWPRSVVLSSEAGRCVRVGEGVAHKRRLRIAQTLEFVQYQLFNGTTSTEVNEANGSPTGCALSL